MFPDKQGISLFVSHRLYKVFSQVERSLIPPWVCSFL
jgi:hypothetical protein